MWSNTEITSLVWLKHVNEVMNVIVHTIEDKYVVRSYKCRYERHFILQRPASPSHISCRFLRVCRTSLLKTLWEKEKLLATSNAGFYVSAVQVFWKHCGKMRNCSQRVIPPFPTLISTCLETFPPFSSNLKLSSAKSFNLEECTICCLGKG